MPEYCKISIYENQEKRGIQYLFISFFMKLNLYYLSAYSGIVTSY